MPDRAFGRQSKRQSTSTPKKKLVRKNLKDSEPSDIDTPEESLLEKIEEELESEGIRMFTNENIADEYLELPMDLSDVPSQELGRYLHAFTQQKNWTRTLIARVMIMNKDSLRKVDAIRDQIYQQLPLKMSVKEKELRLVSDKTAKKLLDSYDFYTSKLNVLQLYIDSVEDGIFSISREITRRNSDFGNENRMHNIDGRSGRGNRR